MRNRFILICALSLAACSPADDDGAPDVADAAGGADVGDMAVGGETLTIARIVDKSGDECGMFEPEQTRDPGADIFAVSLETESGEPIAWGRIVYGDAIIGEENDFGSSAMLDGSPLQLEPDRNCPDPLEDGNMLSLGCGGWIAVEFVDETGATVDLTVASRNRIRVYEAGNQCEVDSSSDRYDLAVCTNPMTVIEGDPGSCGILLLQGVSGEQYAPLAHF